MTTNYYPYDAQRGPSNVPPFTVKRGGIQYPQTTTTNTSNMSEPDKLSNDIQLLEARYDRAEQENRQLRVDLQSMEGRILYQKMISDQKIADLETAVKDLSETLKKFGGAISKISDAFRSLDGGAEAMEELEIAEFFRDLGVTDDKNSRGS